MEFKLISPFKPAGDQPQAIDRLVRGLRAEQRHQVLLGVTGSGKTFTIANVIAKIRRPTLVISPNKTLAAQLFQEFKSFFPASAVHFFVSYYDYYQPEAYLPQTDTYIEKDAKINDEIDRLRHAATAALLTRRDVIIVASVSCIYNIGDPQEYQVVSLELTTGEVMRRDELLRHLIELYYTRNDYDTKRGAFRVRGERIDIFLPAGEDKITVTFGRNRIAEISRSGLSPDAQEEGLEQIRVFPAKHFITPRPKLELALANIRAELALRIKELTSQGKLLEVERLERRTNFDLEMLHQTGYCPGIENYSRHLTFREPGSPPFTLLDYFPASPAQSTNMRMSGEGSRKDTRPARSAVAQARRAGGPNDFLTIIDESHIAVPQIKGMYEGDRARKEILIEYGFRLPSALDNRPLAFKEFEAKVGQIIYNSATPGPYELRKASQKGVVEQLIRPTGLLDPRISVRPTKNQVTDLVGEVERARKHGERVLILTLTQRLAEELSQWLEQKGVRTHWLHAEVKTLERTSRLRALRSGEVDVMVGINLLREGLDLPEVALVAILDADKEGYLRNARSLIQMMGRAARHEKGRVILYADTMTRSMREAGGETRRRRKVQERWNQEQGIKPRSVSKPIRGDIVEAREEAVEYEMPQGREFRNAILAFLRKKMREAASRLDFEAAAELRNKIRKLQSEPVR